MDVGAEHEGRDAGLPCRRGHHALRGPVAAEGAFAPRSAKAGEDGVVEGVVVLGEVPDRGERLVDDPAEAAGHLRSGQRGPRERRVRPQRFRTGERDGAHPGQEKDDDRADRRELPARQSPPQRGDPCRSEQVDAADDGSREQTHRERPADEDLPRQALDDEVDLDLRGGEERGIGSDVPTEGVDRPSAAVGGTAGGRGRVLGGTGDGDLPDVDAHPQSERQIVPGRDEEGAQRPEVEGEPRIGGDAVLRLMGAEAQIGTGGEERPGQGDDGEDEEQEEETG
ncbi:Uncharacterised protein [Mycobacteroides abscessus subsp. abscessus]|nr:Uncharacterised protein [Mycobacteroides abscessus subsp. abscessus]